MITTAMVIAISALVAIGVGVLMRDEARRTHMAQLWERERSLIHALDSATVADIDELADRSERLQMDLVRVGAYIDADGLRLRTMISRRRVRKEADQVREWMG